MADMHLVYGEANCSGAAARELYRSRFPNRRIPGHNMFGRLHNRLRETGSFEARMNDTGAERRTRTRGMEEAVLLEVENDPGTSTRAIGARLGVSHSSVWRILHEDELHPYHVQRVQALSDGDYQQRVDFAGWFLQQIAAAPNFAADVLFTDEAMFTLEGICNVHNVHVWAHENPRATRPHAAQRRCSINVWAGLLGDSVIGPYVLPSRLNGETYRTFLAQVLPELLNDVPLHVRQRMWFQHDGAPAHFSGIARQHLDATFPGRWIGRGGPIPWPPRSPDLSPIDFFLWGYMKSLVYETPVESDMDLMARIVAASGVVADTPGILANVRRSMRRRCAACITSAGRNFEHLL